MNSTPPIVSQQVWVGAGTGRRTSTPKHFFAPGKSDWKPEDEAKPYGNHGEIIVSPATWLLQRSCSAIILVNPPADSAPLELSATVIR